MCKNCQSNMEHHCGCENDSSCDCSEHPAKFTRCYQTKAEQITELETYLNDLKTEVKAVEEHLADLRK